MDGDLMEQAASIQTKMRRLNQMLDDATGTMVEALEELDQVLNNRSQKAMADGR